MTGDTDKQYETKRGTHSRLRIQERPARIREELDQMSQSKDTFYGLRAPENYTKHEPNVLESCARTRPTTSSTPTYETTNRNPNSWIATDLEPSHLYPASLDGATPNPRRPWRNRAPSKQGILLDSVYREMRPNRSYLKESSESQVTEKRVTRTNYLDTGKCAHKL